jgi:prepilin-type N-terminal cleavage/methylation domain-containing protein/prepilin-type processing-associated H-X9-DG protein
VAGSGLLRGRGAGVNVKGIMRTILRGRGRQRRGFTLTELLVVIGVIALLIGILLPTLSKARESSRKAACLANLRSLGQAQIIYANIWKDCLPNGSPPGPKATTPWFSYDGQNQVLVYLANEIVKGPATFHCPSDISSQPDKILTGEWSFDDSARISYEFFSVWWPHALPCKLSKLKGRAPLSWDTDGGEPVDPVTSIVIESNDSPLRNHKGGANVLFSDGHAEWQDQKQWNLKNLPSPAAEFYPTPG